MFSYDEAIMEKIFSDNLGNNNIYVEDSEGNLIDLPFKCDFTISFEKKRGVITQGNRKATRLTSLL